MLRLVVPDPYCTLNAHSLAFPRLWEAPACEQPHSRSLSQYDAPSGVSVVGCLTEPLPIHDTGMGLLPYMHPWVDVS